MVVHHGGYNRPGSGWTGRAPQKWTTGRCDASLASCGVCVCDGLLCTLYCSYGLSTRALLCMCGVLCAASCVLCCVPCAVCQVPVCYSYSSTVSDARPTGPPLLPVVLTVVVLVYTCTRTLLSLLLPAFAAPTYVQHSGTAISRASLYTSTAVRAVVGRHGQWNDIRLRAQAGEQADDPRQHVLFTSHLFLATW